MSTIERGIGATGSWVDERLRGAGFLKRTLNKVYPDHGPSAGRDRPLQFIVLLLSGTFLTLFYKPSMVEVVYEGSYVPLRGWRCRRRTPPASSSASTFAVGCSCGRSTTGRRFSSSPRWSSQLRAFFTGAFRKPRELNWLLGVGLLTLGLGAGFTGYSLPDDLLSGTGLRIAEGIMLAIPLVGTYVSYFIFGGDFPAATSSRGSSPCTSC